MAFLDADEPCPAALQWQKVVSIVPGWLLPGCERFPHCRIRLRVRKEATRQILFRRECGPPKIARKAYGRGAARRSAGRQTHIPQEQFWRGAVLLCRRPRDPCISV